MDLNLWWTFFAACWLIALSPGSGAVLSMSHGLVHGVRRTGATIAGLQVGLAVVLLIAGAGVGAVLLASATAFWVVKVLGAGYLFWLGWQQWRAPVSAAPAVASDTVGTQGATGFSAPQAASARQRFMAGLLTNLTNPKGIVFMVAVLPQFIDPVRPLWMQLLVLMLTSMAVDTVVMHGYAFAASRLQRWMRGERAQRTQNKVFGGVLMAMGTSLVMVRRGMA